MTWNALPTIAATQEWQYTPIIAPELGYVRLKFDRAGVPIWIAQADITDPDDVLFWDDRRFITTAHSRVLEFEAPPFFSDRVLAVRLPIFSTPWNIQFEVSNMPISRGPVAPAPMQPVISTNVTSTTVGAQTSSRVLLAANSNRKLATITNLSPGILSIELGPLAGSGNSMIALGQGDMYELPIAYTGVISGVWSADGGSGALVREFL